MNTRSHESRPRAGAASLVLVLVVTAACILVVSGVLSWTGGNNHLTQRLNRYDVSKVAAAAATEKVAARMMRDFQNDDNAAVLNNLDVYRSLIPTAEDLLSVVGLLTLPSSQEWSAFEFSDAQGNVGQTYVGVASPWMYTNIGVRFPGLKGHCSTYRLISNTRNTASTLQPVSAIKQDVMLVSVPVFHYQIFYGPDLEIAPGAGMTVAGRVHCNRNIYCQPAEWLTFRGPVTASGRLLRDKHPLDPVMRTAGPVQCLGGYESGVNTMHLALGTNTSLAAAHSIIEVPPLLELVDSTFGRQRLYNKADLIIRVLDTGGVATSGAYNNFTTIIPWSELAESTSVFPGTWTISLLQAGRPDDDDDDDDDGRQNNPDDNGNNGDNGRRTRKRPGWLNRPGATNTVAGVVTTNVTFFNARENKTVLCTEIDIVQLIAKFDYLTSLLGRPVKTLYVADLRTQSSGTQSGVRIVGGETLPSGGLTIVTPNPLYIWGHYNVPTAYLGTTNTSASVPAALIGDAITLLSANWLDANSTKTLSARVARSTTVNAALLGGIVPTGSGYYSGGLENFPRLLEDWSTQTLTFNGSMVALYHSAVATAPWGAGAGIYKPPRRAWWYDSKLSDKSGLPPNTPEVRTIIRKGWETVQANQIN